jgi:uncharacterized protein with GYD domain
MATYLMFGEYSPARVDEIRAERTQDATATIGDCGGKLEGGYALLGDKDLVLIVDFPGTEAVMKASLELSKLLGISFSTVPAVSIEAFDSLLGG